MTRHTVPLEPDPESDAPPAPARPARPASIELAAALLIVGGVLGILGTSLSASRLPAGIEPFLAMTVALDLGSVVIGLLVRLGRVWILDVNYAAVLGFIDLLGSGASPLALMLGIADVLVVVILMVHKPWFDELGRWRAERRVQPLTPPTARPPTR